MRKIQSSAKSKKDLVPGDIVAIPLNKSQYAFARIYENFGLGVYDYISEELSLPQNIASTRFILHGSYFPRAMRDGHWTIVGHIEFTSNENPIGPPRWHQDVISGKYELRQGDARWPTTEEETEGLSEDVMYFSVGLLRKLQQLFGDRLIGRE